MRIRKKVWSSDEEPILVIMAVLLVLGTINVFSSSFVLATTDFDDPYYFLVRHIVWLVLGTALCITFSRMNYHRWQSPVGTWGFCLVVGILLAAVLGVGVVVNGARRWLAFGGFSLQPAEFAKLLGIILCTKALAARVRAERLVTVFRAKEYWIMFLFFGLIELEPDMGTACIVLGVPLLMALVCGLVRWERNLMCIGIPVLALLLILMQPYRLERIRIMWDPWADAQGIGYQTVQSLSTIGSGGFLGMGLGDGVSKYEYLPEAHTDFAFAIFAQEHGYIGVVMVFMLFVILVLCCARVSNRARDAYGQIMALGIMLLITGQAAANLAMVGGMFAVVGVPLPFISYGGSSLVVSMSAMGILLNISRHGISPKERRELEAREEAAQLAEAEKKRAAFRRVK